LRFAHIPVRFVHIPMRFAQIPMRFAQIPMRFAYSHALRATFNGADAAPSFSGSDLRSSGAFEG
jgi:hypothetical protein